MSTVPAAASSNEFVDFWNDVLVPKFIKYRHILVGGLTHHSEKIFPTLEISEGDKAVDVGCGFGDTAIQIAKRVGPEGSVLGMDCCKAFLEFARADAKAAGISNVTFVEGDVQGYPFEPVHDFCFSRFRHPVLRESGCRAQEYAHLAQAGRHHDHDCLADHRRQSLARHAEAGHSPAPAASR